MEIKIGDRFIENCSKLEIEVVGFDAFGSRVNLREAAPNGKLYVYQTDCISMVSLIELGHWTHIPKEPEHLETNQEALERLDLKVGDRVKVLRKAKSKERDWLPCWGTKMDDYVGKVFKVVEISQGDLGVRLLGPKISADEYDKPYFPAFVLEKVEKEKPLPTTGMEAIMPKQEQLDLMRPSYYGGADSPYEVRKVIEAWGLGFNLGNVIKYVGRAGKKSDDPIADLKKALTYINFEIEKLKHEKAKPIEAF